MAAVTKPRQKRLRLIQGEYLLSIESVMTKCDIGRTKLAEMVSRGEFPQPLNDPRLGSLVRWRGQDIDLWIIEMSRSLSSQLRAVQ